MRAKGARRILRGLEGGPLRGEFARLPPVVRIEKRDVRPARGLRSGVAGEAGPEVPGVAQHAHAGIADRLHDLHGVIGGLVVHDDDFEIREGLREDAPHGARDGVRPIMAGNDDGDHGASCGIAPAGAAGFFTAAS